MVDNTDDISNEKPYRFAHSPITDEVFVVWFGPRGNVNVSEMFMSQKTFYQFLMDGLETAQRIAGLPAYQAEEILKAKRGDINDSDNGTQTDNLP